MNVYTKQHEAVLEQINKTGRYITNNLHVADDYIGFKEYALQAYDWLAGHAPSSENKPDDADYPIWVSLDENTIQFPEPGYVIFKLDVDPARVDRVNINKWGTMLNLSYIPVDDDDHDAHIRMLNDYGVSDTKAYMTQFYPDIKREIRDSWERLFDDSINMGSDACYGIIWEIRKEDIIAIRIGAVG